MERALVAKKANMNTQTEIIRIAVNVRGIPHIAKVAVRIAGDPHGMSLIPLTEKNEWQIVGTPLQIAKFAFLLGKEGIDLPFFSAY